MENISTLYVLPIIVFFSMGPAMGTVSPEAITAVCDANDIDAEVIDRELGMICLIPDSIRDEFRDTVFAVADRLCIEPDWLMVVMWAESRFDPNVFNREGSGAVGLIQWVRPTARELGTTTADLSRMTMVQQMKYVSLYLDMVRYRFGDYDSLTDLYLGILYPKARKKGFDYVLYSNPSKAYSQNKGLDRDSDGKVTVREIDIRMNRLLKSSY